MMRTVLVVDDKEMMRDSVATTLQRAGFTVLTAPDGTQGLDIVAKKRPDAVVTDMRMPGLSGMELLEKIREIDDELPIVLMTAFGTIETAVKAMKMGAFDYLTKPFEGDELIITVKRAVEHRRLVRENAVLRMNATPGAPGSTGTGGIIASGAQAHGARSPDRRVLRDAAVARPVAGDRGLGRHGPGHGRERLGQGSGRAGDP
jgi:two-component system response regulator AtoC